MKCSTCGFITDPSKDLCSRCFSDLRKEKIELGLTVANSGASYEELLAKKVKIIDASKKPDDKKKADLKLKPKKTLFNIFRKKSALELPDSAHEIPEDNDSPSLDSTKIEEAVIGQDALAQNDADEKVSPGAQKLRLGKRQKQQILGLLRKAKLKDEALEQKSQNEQLAIDKERISSSSLFVERREMPDDHVELWNQSFQDLDSLSVQVSQRSAIQVSSMLTQDSQTALSIYFDLVFEELSQPHKKREFITQLGDRKVESIESKALKDAVGQFQQESARLKASELDYLGKGKVDLVGLPAGNRIRLMAWILDFTCAIITSLLLGTIIHISSSPLLSSILLGARSFAESDLFSIVIFALPIFYLSILFFFPLARNLMGFTLGEYATRLRLVSTENGRKVSFFTSLGWTLMSALGFLSLGLLELKRGPELWRERILGARLLRT